MVADPVATEHLLGTDDHLHTDETQDDAQALVEERELVLERVEDEVERTEPEDRHRVGREDDERITSDREDGRHRVDGEEHVGDLHSAERDEEHRSDALAVLVGEQRVSVQLVADRHDLADELDELAGLRIEVIVVTTGTDLEARVEQEGTQQQQRPLEPLDDGHTGEDEDRPHDQRAEDAPEEDTVLVLVGDVEERQDDRPHEHVVDAEALLDHVSREVLSAAFAAVDHPDDHANGNAEGDPREGLDGSRADRDVLVLPVQNGNVEDDDGQHEGDEDGPMPPGNIELGVLGSSLASGTDEVQCCVAWLAKQAPFLFLTEQAIHAQMHCANIAYSVRISIPIL